MILKTIFIFCLTLKIYGAVGDVGHEERIMIRHCQQVVDKKLSFGHDALREMTTDQENTGYRRAFRYLFQRLTPRYDFVHILRSLVKFAGWSRSASDVMRDVRIDVPDCTFESLLRHTNSALGGELTDASRRNLTVAKARLMRLSLESRMTGDRTIDAYNAADPAQAQRLEMFNLLNSVMSGSGVKVRFIEMAQLVSDCGYSFVGNREEDLVFARDTINKYFEITPRGKRHFDEIGSPIRSPNRTQTVTDAAAMSSLVAPVPYVVNNGEKQRALGTLDSILSQLDGAGVHASPVISLLLPAASASANGSGASSAVMVSGSSAAVAADDFVEEGTERDDEVTIPSQRRRIELTQQQKENIAMYLNAGWSYNKIAGTVGCSIHEVIAENETLQQQYRS